MFQSNPDSDCQKVSCLAFVISLTLRFVLFLSDDIRAWFKPAPQVNIVDTIYSQQVTQYHLFL